MGAATMRAKMRMPFRSTAGARDAPLIPRRMLRSIVAAVPRMRDTMVGRMPLNVARTPPYFKSLVKRDATRRIMTKDGVTTPRVARRAPKNPP